jgi:hypothetical protein
MPQFTGVTISRSALPALESDLTKKKESGITHIGLNAPAFSALQAPHLSDA